MLRCPRTYSGRRPGRQDGRCAPSAFPRTATDGPRWRRVSRLDARRRVGRASLCARRRPGWFPGTRGGTGKANALMTKAVRESVTMAGRAERARVARVFTAGVLGPGHPCGDDAALLVSCSATASDTATIAVRAGGGVVRVDVTDRGGRGVPQLRPSGDEAEGVRGLGWSGLGRTTCRRKTAISWRSTRISASLAASLRARSASQPSTRTINRQIRRMSTNADRN